MEIFLSNFDKNDYSHAETENIALNHHFLINHDVAANRGKIKGQLLI